MRQTAIRISDSYDLPASRREALGAGRRRYGATQVSPDELGGWFDYTDWRGEAVSRQHFLGRWTLLYFGYCRCAGSCRQITPVLADAAETLRLRGYPARAAFVDIETHHVARPQMITKSSEAHVHEINWAMRHAQAARYRENEGRLSILSGTRAQLARATAAFHVLREHVPPKAGQDGHEINHSSMVYVIGPDTLVAAYGYHDIERRELVSLVEELADADRRAVDLAAVRARYERFSCGGDLA